jgi:serine/threonine protein kinase
MYQISATVLRSMSSRSRIVGEYVISEKIGKGSFADVYNCKHEATSKKYALKIVNREHLMQLGEPRLIAGLESEIKFMKDLDHENIVRLHEFFSTEKNFYLVLELCLGGDLNKYIRKKKKLEEKVAMGFLLQIVRLLTMIMMTDNAVDNKICDFRYYRQMGWHFCKIEK